MEGINSDPLPQPHAFYQGQRNSIGGAVSVLALLVHAPVGGGKIPDPLMSRGLGGE